MPARYVQGMDCDDIRAWVRGTLSPERCREVGRYLLRSTDPRIPAILQGLIREHERELRSKSGAIRSRPV
jgi:hypothetical protein